MTKVYLDTQYPKNLEKALQLLHELQYPKNIEVIRTNHFDNPGADYPVIFLFDRTKKGLDIITEKHFEAGYRVFAFKSKLVEKFDVFELSLSVLTLWPRIMDTINEEKIPFIFTYKYSGSKLIRAK